jgi:hypothetical protein
MSSRSTVVAQEPLVIGTAALPTQIAWSATHRTVATIASSMAQKITAGAAQ